jgi:hypothetical protein
MHWRPIVIGTDRTHPDSPMREEQGRWVIIGDIARACSPKQDKCFLGSSKTSADTSRIPCYRSSDGLIVSGAGAGKYPRNVLQYCATQDDCSNCRVW